MKRILIVLMVLLLAVTLTACSTGGVTSTGSNVATESGKTTPAGSGYALIYNSVTIAISAPAAPIVKALGKPLSYFEAPSCAFKGLDKTYTYSGMQLLTYPVDDVDYVFSVILMDDTISTPEGVALGDTLDSVTSAYGDGYVKKDEMYTYTKGDSSLSFLMQDGKVTSIEYDMVTK